MASLCVHKMRNSDSGHDFQPWDVTPPPPPLPLLNYPKPVGDTPGRCCRAEKGSSATAERRRRCRRAAAPSCFEAVAPTVLSILLLGNIWSLVFTSVSLRKENQKDECICVQSSSWVFICINAKWRCNKHPSFLALLNKALIVSLVLLLFTHPQWTPCASSPVRLTYSAAVMFNLGYFQSEHRCIKLSHQRLSDPLQLWDSVFFMCLCVLVGQSVEGPPVFAISFLLMLLQLQRTALVKSVRLPAAPKSSGATTRTLLRAFE